MLHFKKTQFASHTITLPCSLAVFPCTPLEFDAPVQLVPEVSFHSGSVAPVRRRIDSGSRDRAEPIETLHQRKSVKRARRRECVGDSLRVRGDLGCHALGLQDPERDVGDRWETKDAEQDVREWVRIVLDLDVRQVDERRMSMQVPGCASEKVVDVAAQTAEGTPCKQRKIMRCNGPGKEHEFGNLGAGAEEPGDISRMALEHEHVAKRARDGLRVRMPRRSSNVNAGIDHDTKQMSARIGVSRV
uniref:Uncharacterized protein n=1 Tax=Mycena chlorophos TaxID=658473 RepID=A0ABQ0L350_MYCCL|nr:predicted protein [Mycena chlorophos]